jgi:hypothetical protein
MGVNLGLNKQGRRRPGASFFAATGVTLVIMGGLGWLQSPGGPGPNYGGILARFSSECLTREQAMGHYLSSPLTRM